MSASEPLHVICERDVGLFSLIHQVIANIPWATRCNRTPIVYFGARTCYWTPYGYRGSDSVWEYYFEPVVTGWPVSAIPPDVRCAIDAQPPGIGEVGRFVTPNVFACAQYGDHPEVSSLALPIPYLYGDPGKSLRVKASEIIQTYVRPKPEVVEKAVRYFEIAIGRRRAIGVHVRGTDAISPSEGRAYRRGSLNLSNYATALNDLFRESPEMVAFVATDDESSLSYLQTRFGNRILSYDSIRHKGGDVAGAGPLGCIMPAYITGDRSRAAQNGEEAVIEYLILSMCELLIHNGSSLARTVLLNKSEMPHINTHTYAEFPSASEERSNP